MHLNIVIRDIAVVIGGTAALVLAAAIGHATYKMYHNRQSGVPFLDFGLGATGLTERGRMYRRRGMVLGAAFWSVVIVTFLLAKWLTY